MLASVYVSVRSVCPIVLQDKTIRVNFGGEAEDVLSFWAQFQKIRYEEMA